MYPVPILGVSSGAIFERGRHVAGGKWPPAGRFSGFAQGALLAHLSDAGHDGIETTAAIWCQDFRRLLWLGLVSIFFLGHVGYLHMTFPALAGAGGQCVRTGPFVSLHSCFKNLSRQARRGVHPGKPGLP